MTRSEEFDNCSWNKVTPSSECAQDLRRRVNRLRMLPRYLMNEIYIDILDYLYAVKYQESRGLY